MSRRGRVFIALVAAYVAATVAMRRRGYGFGGNVVVRCRAGHLFTTIWIPGASLKALRLGWWRFQRCPVGDHWTFVTPVKESELTEEERRLAAEHKDIRVPRAHESGPLRRVRRSRCPRRARGRGSRRGPRALTAKPASVPWEVAGSLFVVGLAAYASVEAVAPRPGETVVVSAAAGGVGSVAVQLARRTGATVIGLASERNHGWLRPHDIVPVTYGEGQDTRIRDAATGPVDAVIDTFGGGYVDLAVELGVAPDRINTIIDFQAAQRVGAHTQGTHAVATKEILAELAELVADGSLEIPIAKTFPLDHVREAFEELAKRQTRGKIALLP